MKVDTSTISIFISVGALLISGFSIFLSILNYRKDRWKLSLEPWIEPGPSNPPFHPGSIRATLFVRVANIGRRALTIENIRLEVFEDEIEELDKSELASVKRQSNGWIAAFHYVGPQMPAQLDENEPMRFEFSLVAVDSEKFTSKNRRCIINVTGRKKPIKVWCGLPSDSGDRKVYHFSGS